MRDAALQALRELNEVVEQLRAPGGCPWDREQTHESLRPYLLEETYEALEAIESEGGDDLREELGDLLLQVLMHSAIAQEGAADGFDVGDVAEGARRKMVGRHPHVFAGSEVGGAAEVVVNWERLKGTEKAERLSLLDGLPRSLPALAFALGVQKRPARVGFDLHPTWPEAAADVRRALESAERVATVAAPDNDVGADWNVVSGGARPGQSPVPAEPGSAPSRTPDPALSPGADVPSLEEAMGDLLFAVVALARRVRVNPEDALRRRATRFGARFRALEADLRAGGGDVHGTSADEWRSRWEAGQRN